MNKYVNILFICDHEDILATVLRLIGQRDEWKGYGTGSAEEAIELFHQHRFDLVMFGSGIPAETEQKLRTIFQLQDPNIKIIEHFGGGSGLLSNEIEAALSNNAQGNYSILDNPFNEESWKPYNLN